MPKVKRYMWKGKVVTEKVYNQRLAQRNTGKHNLKTRDENTSTAEKESTDEEQKISNEPGEGRRIVDLKFLGKQLWCTSCKESLSLDNIEQEEHRGLGSVLLIRCHKCLLVNPVVTGKQHTPPGKSRRDSRFDVNTKLAIGLIHSGIGFTNLNKLLACLNIPPINFKTYKRYEAEAGGALEIAAKESCQRAVELERQLTLENKATIEENMPDSVRSCFNTSQESSTDPHPVTFDTVVRVMASYDMGWTTRGTGRDYDSLNGFGSIVGHFSQQILDYSTCNRKCKKCDLGHSPFDHDCRLNFRGSAKAMESHAANKLVNKSDILKSKNVEIGILVGDDDSSAIAACRAGASHSIAKLSDVNHTSKGVKKCLYNIEKQHKELTKDGITYLHRCFTYAMTQNRGKSTAMAEAIRSIPYHAFNQHEKCGQWCGYVKDKENYNHRMIPGGFTDLKLFEVLKCYVQIPGYD